MSHQYFRDAKSCRIDRGPHGNEKRIDDLRFKRGGEIAEDPEKAKPMRWQEAGEWDYLEVKWQGVSSGEGNV